MKFGIIGAGNIGKTVSAHLLRAGHTVIVSNSKGPGSLSKTIADLGPGAIAGTTEEAAEAEIVLLALPWSQLATLTNLTDWTGRIVIDATNHFISFAPEFKLADIGDKASSEVVADYVPGARLVKAFNTLFYKVLEKNPAEASGKRVIFISGNDPQAKQEVAHAIESTGFATIDLGDLATGSKLQQPKNALASVNLIKA